MSGFQLIDAVIVVVVFNMADLFEASMLGYINWTIIASLEKLRFDLPLKVPGTLLNQNNGLCTYTEETNIIVSCFYCVSHDRLLEVLCNKVTFAW